MALPLLGLVRGDRGTSQFCSFNCQHQDTIVSCHIGLHETVSVSPAPPTITIQYPWTALALLGLVNDGRGTSNFCSSNRTRQGHVIQAYTRRSLPLLGLVNDGRGTSNFCSSNRTRQGHVIQAYTRRSLSLQPRPR